VRPARRRPARARRARPPPLPSHATPRQRPRAAPAASERRTFRGRGRRSAAARTRGEVGRAELVEGDGEQLGLERDRVSAADRRAFHERLVEELHRAAELPVGGECATEVKGDAHPLLRGAGELPGPPQMRVQVHALTGGGLLEAELVQHRRDLIGRRRLLEGAAQVGDRSVRGTPGARVACRGPQHAEPLGVTGAGDRQQVAGDAFTLRVAARLSAAALPAAPDAAGTGSGGRPRGEQPGGRSRARDRW
jgi:hypothetical protein